MKSKQLFSCMILFFLAGVVLAIQEPDKIVKYKTVGDVELNLYIFNPNNHKVSDETAAIVFFFGGGWNGGSPAQFYNQSEYLASRGMVAICADYRVKSRHNVTPKECVKDAKSAMRWVRSNAEKLGINPDMIAAGGGSAGGHLAVATATLTAFNEEGEDVSVACMPQALVLFNPVFDNSVDGFAYERVKDYWQQFSPMHNIDSKTPPTIVLLGTEDKLIPVETAQKYKKVMEKAGNRCDLHLYEGQPHGFFNVARYYETVLDMDKFLVSLGYITGEPTVKKKVVEDDE